MKFTSVGGAVTPTAAQVSYLQAGNAAIPRTVQDRLREKVSVKDFGAVGDGVNDDRGAIQNCINAFGPIGTAIYFPAGTYRVTSQLNVQNNHVYLIGDGVNASTILFDPANGFPPPSVAAISAISRSGNVVTATVPAGKIFAAGQVVVIAGVTNTSFNGPFVVTSYSGTALVYSQLAPNAVSSGGTATPGVTCLQVQSPSPIPGQIIVYGGIMGLSFFSNDSAWPKTAINVVGIREYLIRDCFVGGSIVYGGTNLWSDTSFNSIALLTNGHEALTVDDCVFMADEPLVMGPNPNSNLSADHFIFNDIQLIANNNPCCYVRDNTQLTMVSFLGRQVWARGTYGFFWNNSFTSSSLSGLRFDNVRWEQVQGTAGYAVLITFIGPNPAPITSLTRSGGTVTATVPAGLSNISAAGGQALTIAGVSDSSFNGVYTSISYTGTTLTWTQTGQPPASSTGGTVNAALGNLRQLTMMNCLFNTEATANGFYFRNVISPLLMNVATYANGVALDIDNTSGGFVFWNCNFGVSPAVIHLGTPPTSDFIIYNLHPGQDPITLELRNRLSFGTMDQTGYLNLPYAAAINQLNNTGVSKRLIGLGITGGGGTIAPNFIGIDSDGDGVVMGGILRLGNYLGGDNKVSALIVPNNTSISADADGTGTNTVAMARVNPDSSVSYGVAASNIGFGGAIATFNPILNFLSGNFGTGPGPNAVLGGIGGGGPANAGQAGWQEVQLNGSTFWFPVWH